MRDQGSTTRCRCGHDRAAHEHYRRGTDCSLCPPSGCDRYRPAVGWWRRLTAARVGRRDDRRPGPA